MGWERKDLGDESVQVGISRALDVQIPAAHVVDGLIVVHHGHFGMFQEGVARQDAVVRLHCGTRDLWAREDAHGQIGFLAVVDRQHLQKQGTKSRASPSTHGMEDKEICRPVHISASFRILSRAKSTISFPTGSIIKQDLKIS